MDESNESIKAYNNSDTKETFKMKQKKARDSGKPYLKGKKKTGYIQVPQKEPAFTQVNSMCCEC